MRILPVLSLFVALCGCASTHYSINAPLARIDPDGGYRLRRVESEADGDGDAMFVHLSLSGGGMRAAAFAHGVIEELAATPIQWQGRETTLWREVDVISSVSGGSLVAGFVAAHGDAVLRDFVPTVLEGTLQTDLLAASFSPRGLWQLTSPRFGRSDVLQRVLDASVFRGARYADVAASRRRPFVLIAASEMRSGLRFEFTQDRFDLLCSDLGSVPLARAVAASAAAPIVLSPVTFWSYGSGCRQSGPERQADRAAPSAVRPASPPAAPPKAQGFVHVVDGGLTDNLAARILLDVNARHGVAEVARQAGFRRVSQVVFIVVDAETSARFTEDDSADVPGVLRSALALADIPINHLSDDSRVRLREATLRWQAEMRGSGSAGPEAVFRPDVEFHLIEISLRDWPEEALRSVSTSLQLDRHTSAALRDAAREMLRASPALGRLLRRLAGS